MDEITGNFEGWQNIPLWIGLVSAALAVLMTVLFITRHKKNPYSYKNIAIMGFGIFVLIIAIDALWYYFEVYDNSTYYAMIIYFIFGARLFVLFSMPILFAFFLFMTITDIILISKEGFSLGNDFGMIIAILLLIAGGVAYYMEYYPSIYITNEMRNTFYILYCYFTCQFFAVIFDEIIIGEHKPDLDKDYILILGCQIRDDGSLYPTIRGRVEEAITFAEKQLRLTGKAAIFMPTGGKGSDERLSEGEAMKRYLILNKIPEERIIAETESTTTYENLVNCRRIINDDTKKVAFSTTNYHVFRSGIIANEIGWKIDGMGAKTVMYNWPNAMAREFIALIAKTWKVQIVMALLLTGIAIYGASLIG